MTQQHSSEDPEELYFMNSKDVIVKHKLLSNLSKEHYEDEDSVQSQTAHTVASRKLHRVLQKRDKTNMPLIFLIDTEREHLNYTCTYVKVMMDWKFNYKEFYVALCIHPVFPLEFVVRLHLLGIISFDTYLSEIQNQPEVVSVFCKSVVALFSQHDPNVEFEHLMVSSIAAYVLNKVFIENIEENDELEYLKIKKICKLILDSTIKRFVTSRQDQSESTKLPSLIFYWDNLKVGSFSLKAFCNYALGMIITCNPNIEVTQAISQQSNWTHKNAERNLSSLSEKILTTLNSDDISSMILDVINMDRQNWKFLLTVISICLTSCQLSSMHVLSWVELLLKRAFEKFEQTPLFQGFLIARHTTLPEHSDSPSAYFNWFQKTFGDPLSLAKDAKSFEFFIKFLTELVPDEKEEYLKVHVEKAPYTPKNSRAVYLDYVALVKTRLSELKPQHSPDVVLNKMLASFEATGKIPATLLELSILQKHRYLNYFLPQLLTPRVLPYVPDVKMKFLLELKKRGKIPKEMFEKYEVECKKAAEKLLDVEPMDVEVKGISEQITDWSMEFMFQIQDCIKDANSLKRYLQEFRQKLLMILKQFQTSDCQTPVILLNSETDMSLKEVMHEILATYCGFQSEIINMNLQNPMMWDLALDLQDFQKLHGALYQALWEKVTSQDKKTMLVGSSLLLLRISVLQPKYPLMKEYSSSNNPQLFCDFVFKTLPFTSSDEIDYFCRFSCHYLNSACHQDICNMPTVSALPSFIPVNLIKKFHFAAVRSIPQLRGQAINIANIHLNEVATMCSSKKIMLLFAITKITFSEWLTFESNILPEKDDLSMEERYKYCLWCIHHLCDFQPDAFNNSSCDKIKYCCKSIFQLLLSKYDKCPAFKNIIVLIKDLLKSVLQSDSEVSTTSKPWIYEELNTAIRNLKESKYCDLHVKIIITSFSRLIYDLPCYLLFQDFFFQSTHVHGIKELNYMINNWIRLYNGKDIFLPGALVSHMIKGLMQLLVHSKSCEDFQKNDSVMKSFLSDSPLFVLSLIEHWPIIKGSVPSTPHRQNHLSLLFNDIDSFTTYVKGLQSGKPASSLNIKGLENWEMGYIFMKEKMGDHNFYQNATFEYTSFEVIESAIQFHVALNIAVDSNNASIFPDLLEVVKHLLQLERVHFLDPVHSCKSALKDILSPLIWYHFPAGCLKLLLLVFNEEDVQRTDQQIISNWISLTLACLSECNCRYMNRNTVNQFCHYLNSDDNILKKPYGILNLNFLQEATQAAKTILKSLPLNCIMLIPQDIKESCDEYLKCFFVREMEC